MSSEGGSEEAPENEERSKVYTIRGLDRDLYERFVKTAKELGVTVGDLMNMAMADFLVTLEASKDVSQRVSQGFSRFVEALKSAHASAMKALTSAVADFDLISDINELTVTKADLESLERPVVFSNIKRLTFADDVDISTFNSKVRSIKLVDELVVPKGLPVLQVARKCQLVRKITVKS